MIPPEEEGEIDPRAKVADEISEWAQMEEADGMRSRFGKPPRPPPPAAPGEEPLMPEEGMGGDTAAIPGVELTEDGEEPPADGAAAASDEEIDPEMLKALLAALGG
jgi:hypothetical protein